MIELGQNVKIRKTQIVDLNNKLDEEITFNTVSLTDASDTVIKTYIVPDTVIGDINVKIIYTADININNGLIGTNISISLNGVDISRNYSTFPSNSGVWGSNVTCIAKTKVKKGDTIRFKAQRDSNAVAVSVTARTKALIFE